MTKQILKTILAGVLAGVLLFMMPFIIIKALIFFMLIRAIFRLLGGGRYHGHWRHAYVHQYQNMNEEERKAFMQKYGNRCGWKYNSEPNDTQAGKEQDKSAGE